MLAALLLVFSQAPGDAKVLARGVELPGQPIGYWACEDTTLDASQADRSLGGSAYLNGGIGKVILIRFGDLRRALGPRKRIRSAKIALTMTAADNPRLGSVSEILVPWNEGPVQVVNFSNLGAAPATAAAGAATYRWRRAYARAIDWQQPGASGAADGKLIPGATGKAVEGGGYEISGIEGAIQRTYDSPFDVGGIALRFDTSCEFFSAQSPSGRPKLIVETEDIGPAAGPDLSVAIVSRSPWPDPPTYKLQTVEQDGRSIALVPDVASKRRFWPDEGQAITYSATILNVGDKPASGFAFRWSAEERWGAWTERSIELAPGASTQVTFVKPYRHSPSDHRVQPIAIEIRPLAADANPANNGLEVPETGYAIGASFEGDSAASDTGSSSPIDRVQDHIAALNRVILPYSRFSFAPDGATARVFLQSISVGGKMYGNAAGMDGPVQAVSVETLATTFARNWLLPARLGMAQSPPLGPETPVGLTGRGDTRFEGQVPGTFSIPFEPVSAGLLDTALGPPTGLLSATDVYGLQTEIESRGESAFAYLYDVPNLVVARALDFEGRPLGGAEIRVFAGDREVAKVQAGDTGIFLLPNRPVPKGTVRLKSNAFGIIDAQGSGSEYRIEASVRGQSSSTHLRSWQLVELRARGGAVPAVLDLRFNLSTGAIDPTNHAKGRIVTDSRGTLPAPLAAIVDDQPGTAFRTEGKPSDWIEIDLGRDRSVGEIQVVTGAMWNGFEILGYGTGQTAADALVWVRELNFAWRKTGWESKREGDLWVVPYRAAAQRFRFIRIRARSGGPASIAEVRVFGVAVASPG